MKRLIFYLLPALLVGCAAQQPARPPSVINTATPVCTTKLQCDRMWLDAQEAVVMVTRMRIRLATDNRIETFAPVRHASMGGVVSKYPLGGDRYEIRLALECYRYTECNDLRASGTNLFNNMLGGYIPK